MTDHDPTGPSDPDGSWLRAHLDPVLDAEPTTDRWADLTARVREDLGRDARPGHPPALRWVAAAAVLVLLAGIAVVLVATRSDDTTTISTDQPPVTGWYIPDGLPAGWTLRTAWVAPPPTSCGVTNRGWEGSTPDGGDRRVSLTYVPCGAPEVEPAPGAEPGPSLGRGIDDTQIALVQADPATRLIRWEHEGTWMLRSEGDATEEDLVAAARAIVADPSSTAPPLEGLQLTSANLAAGIPTGPTLFVSLRSPEGDLVSYHLNAPGEGPSATELTTDHPQPVDGQPREVRRRAPRWVAGEEGDVERAGFRRGSAFVGTWPGADLEVPRTPAAPEPGAPTPPAEEEAHERRLLEVIASLRPATTDEWRTFLATAEEQPRSRLFEATSLAELTGHRSSAPTTSTSPKRSASTTTRASVTTTVAAPTPGETPGSVVSGPGVFTERGKTSTSFTPIEDLDVRLELSSDTIRAGQPATATLIMRNDTEEAIEFNECSRGLSRWGLVPASTPDRDPPDHNIIDCYRNEPNIPAHGTVRYPVDWMRPAGFLAQRRAAGLRWWEYGGTLPGGDYLAVMIIPGQSGDLRLAIPVTVADPPCKTTDADVEAYLRHSLEGAKAVARQRGDAIRLASIDGKPEALTDDLRCDRINIDIDGDVVNAVRY